MTVSNAPVRQFAHFDSYVFQYSPGNRSASREKIIVKHNRIIFPFEPSKATCPYQENRHVYRIAIGRALKGIIAFGREGILTA